MKAEAPIGTRIHVSGPRLLNIRAPLIAAAWVIGYSVSFASSRTSTAWLKLAEWGVSHGLGDFVHSSQYVTLTVMCLAVLGAILRVVSPQERSAARNFGFWAVCAPWCVLLPPASAGLYVLVGAAASLAGLLGRSGRRTFPSTPQQAYAPWWQRGLRESFPILSAACFLTMSWQYNALRLMQSLLIAAGVSLLVQAALPSPAKIRPRLPEDPAAAS
jgi:hypothetical protein